MSSQKNSGNKGAKKETGASAKNSKFVQNFLDDLRREGTVADVHIARILRMPGNCRTEVFFVDNSKKTQRGTVVQARIPGKFSGRGKRSNKMGIGSFVAVADSGIGGSAQFEVVAVFEPNQMRDIAKEFDIDPRVLAVDITETAQLTSKNVQSNTTGGYEFGTIDEEGEVDIDEI